jgi:hypothetical protein
VATAPSTAMAGARRRRRCRARIGTSWSCYSGERFTLLSERPRVRMRPHYDKEP